MASVKQKSKVSRVMREHKEGKLTSGSGKKSKEPQAGDRHRDVRIGSIAQEGRRFAQQGGQLPQHAETRIIATSRAAP
jgi:hypothetical protein